MLSFFFFLLGHFYLTHNLLDKIKTTPESRIVNVTCNVYRAGKINFDDLNYSKEYQDKHCYAQSKLANVLFTLKLSDLLKDTNTRIFSVDPGNTQTNVDTLL